MCGHPLCAQSCRLRKTKNARIAKRGKHVFLLTAEKLRAKRKFRIDVCLLFALFCRLHWVWLLYYYVSMALRESILRVNGSRIHPWWLYHHYVSLVLAVVMMTMSEALMATIVSDTTLKFFVFQGKY